MSSHFVFAQNILQKDCLDSLSLQQQITIDDQFLVRAYHTMTNVEIARYFTKVEVTCMASESVAL
jgi:hypothetical protein